MIETHGLSTTSAHYARMGEQECERDPPGHPRDPGAGGVDVHDEKARRILVAGGAKADGLRVRIPEYMVSTGACHRAQAHHALQPQRQGGHASRRISLVFRRRVGLPECARPPHRRTAPPHVLKDVGEASTLMDALPEIDFVMSAFLPEDVDPRIYDRYQMEVMLNNTTKPIVFVTPDFEGCMAAVEMCEVVAGGREAFQQRPFATCYINVTSGLTANAEALQKCMYLAEKGLPQLYIPLNAGGVNSPVTTAGCMASMNAGILLGIVLSQLVREGAAVAVPGWNGGPYNLQTMVGNYVLADEQGVPTSMGKYYDLPVFGLGGSTDSKVLDQQSGFEVTLSLMTALLHGANIVHDVGFMDAGLQGSLQNMVISNEILGFLRAATAGVVVNDETLALDVIDELGPTGNYLGHEHTLRHYKEPFYSKLVDKGPYSSGQTRGRPRWNSARSHGGQDPGEPQGGAAARRGPGGIQAIVEREQKWIDGQ